VIALRDHSFALLVIFAILASLVACAEPTAPLGDVLRIGLEGNPTNLDPRYAKDAYSWQIDSLVYEGLLRPAMDGGVEPALAESCEALDDRTYRCRLKPGLRWQNGKPLTSADVAATYRFIAGKDNKCPGYQIFKRVDRIETPDERTIQLHLDEVFVPFLEKLTWPVVPAELQDPPAFAADPVGSGPYRLVEFKTGDRVVLEANPHYRDGAPAIERLIFQVVANDTTRLLRLKKGDLDLVQNNVPPYAVKFVEQLPGRRLLRQTGVNYSYLGFNLADRRGIVSHRLVRRAIAHAIDREQIIQTLLFGQARAADNLLAPGNWAYEPDVVDYPYDPARARQLLDEAGFPAPDGDGPQVRFTLSYKTSTNKLRMRIAEVIGAQLEEVGVRLERRSFEWGTFFADITKGNFQTYTLTWVGVTDPDHLYSVFHSSMQPDNGNNRGRYVNEQVDAWLDESRRTPDRAARRELYGQIQKQIAEDCVYVSLWWADNIAVFTDRLQGFEIMPGGDYRSLARARLAP